MLMSASVGISAFASMEDAPVADLVFVCENTQVKAGDLIEVTLYINNISLEGGMIACDLPLFYDKDVLELSFQDVIVPQSWGSYYKFLFNAGTGTDFCWLRVVPDVPIGEELDFNAFSVTEDNTLGFTLAFTAKKAGETSLEIKHKAEDNVYMMIVSPELENFPPNSSKLDISIGASDAPENSEEMEITEIPAASEEDSTAEDEPSASTSNDESKKDESSAVTESSTESTVSNVAGDNGENKDGAKDDSFPWGIVIAVVVAVAAVGGGAAFVLTRKKKQ